MRYPVMTERRLAAKWRVSLKTLRRWRSTGEGPAWHKLFHLVRYHDADVLAFEKLGASHWQALLDKGERVPRAVSRPRSPGEPEAPEEIDDHYVCAKELVEATGLPPHIFIDRAQRERPEAKHPEEQRHHRAEIELRKLDRMPRQGGHPLPQGPNHELHGEPGATGPADEGAPP